MPSKWETLMQALATALQDALTPEVLVDVAIPSAVPATGLVILRTGEDSPQPIETTLSPLTYTFAQVAEIEIYATGEASGATFDTIKVAIGETIAADRQLGGLVQWVEAMPPQGVVEAVYGSASVRQGSLPVTITYDTSNPLT